MLRKRVILGAVAAVLLAACSSPTAPAAQRRTPRPAIADEAPTPPATPPQTSSNSGNLFGSGT